MTPTTVQGAIDLFQTALAAVSGVQNAPADPPDQPGSFPFVTTYAWHLVCETNTPEDFRAKWDLRIDFLVAQGTLPDDIQALLTFPETVLNEIWAVIKDNAIPCLDVVADPVAVTWGGIPCVGFSFYVREVKILHTIT